MIRKTMKNWIKESEIKRFEDDWIRALEETPDDPREAESWLHAQAWWEA